MTQEPVSIRRRTFIALIGASSSVVAGCSLLDPSTERHRFEDTPKMNINQTYQISRHYFIGPRQERPPASKAVGTIWEITTPDQKSTTRRTFSDGEHWITLSIESGESPQTPGTYYLTPDDGFVGIQNVIDRTGGNVVIRLAPGTYVGSELTLAHGTVLKGAGRNATKLKLEDGANTDLITTPDPASRNVMECTLRDITVDANRKNNTAGNGVYGAFWNSRFIDCNFYFAADNGFWLAGSEASTDDNQFRGCQFLDNRGMGLRGGANKQSYPAVGVARIDTNWFGYNGGPAISARGNSWKIDCSKFYDNALKSGATIELDRCSYSAITDCDISMKNTDRSLITVTAAKGVNSVGNQVKHNDFRGGYRSGVRCLADESNVIALQVHGNTVQSDGEATSGIVSHKEDGGSFVDCSFIDNTFVGPMAGQKTVLTNEWVKRGNINAG